MGENHGEGERERMRCWSGVGTKKGERELRKKWETLLERELKRC